MRITADSTSAQTPAHAAPRSGNRLGLHGSYRFSFSPEARSETHASVEIEVKLGASTPVAVFRLARRTK